MRSFTIQIGSGTARILTLPVPTLNPGKRVDFSSRSLFLTTLMEKAENSNPKLKIAIIHPDLGIGGAERLIVDAACELVSHGHDVHVFTAHHDKKHCFEETVSGLFPVTVYGDFLPRHIFYRFHAICAYIRCIFVALCVVFFWSSFDVVLVDQVSVVIPLLRIKRATKVQPIKLVL